MLRTQIAPELRALGLTGSGSSYVLQSQEHWAIVGLQKSRTNSAERVRFTVNLTVVRRDIWARAHAAWPSQLSERPAANMDSGALIPEVDRDKYWHQRIGTLMPKKRDHWWEITSTVDPEAIGRDVVAAIRDFALPALREHMTGCT
jgi:uncharacterized protein DUF4304